MNSNVIVSPSYIEFAKELHSLEIFNTFCKVGEWGDIFAGNGVKWSIVYDVAHVKVSDLNVRLARVSVASSLNVQGAIP
jgi:hypothetical protein